MKLFRKLLSHNIVGISSGGGHLTELIDAIPNSISKEVNYVTFKNGHITKSLQHKKHFFIIDPHISKLKYLINSFQSLLVFIYLRPKVIISTGAGIAIPFMLIGYYLGSKIIYIESGARVYTASKTGEFMHKYADLFFVQYKTMLEKYPNSILGSLK
jgi:UDP-N-acetylglucosamine:LPS N-acetylglucosamine transferase